MEVAALGFLFIIYLILRYYLIDHETATDKDMRQFQVGIQQIKIRQINRRSIILIVL